MNKLREIHQAQAVLEQHQHEEHGGDAAEQQMDEIRLAVLIANTQSMPRYGSGGGEKNEIDELLGGGVFNIEKFEHRRNLETWRGRRKPA